MVRILGDGYRVAPRPSAAAAEGGGPTPRVVAIGNPITKCGIHRRAESRNLSMEWRGYRNARKTAGLAADFRHLDFGQARSFGRANLGVAVIACTPEGSNLIEDLFVR